jgi:hypothetical protein
VLAVNIPDTENLKNHETPIKLGVKTSGWKKKEIK